MSSRNNLYEKILTRVRKPSQYIDREFNSIHKDPVQCKVKIALVFPDLYEIGMCNLGIQILYYIVNDIPQAVAERVFAPWVDMEEEMRRHHIPLLSLESRTPVREFDIVGFSIQHELCFTTVLNMIDLAGLAVRASHRSETDPLVIAGGPATFNPEPLAPFMDAFAIGDGEELIQEIVQVVEKSKEESWTRGKTLENLAHLEGIYIPSDFAVTYRKEGAIVSIKPLSFRKMVRKRLLKDLNIFPSPGSPIVPHTEVVHDRCNIEIMRGCTHGCRFCQAGIIYRPVRERSAQKLVHLSRETLQSTGYDELSLASLSTSDYSSIHEVLRQILRDHETPSLSVSLPSLRTDSFSVRLAEMVQEGRRSGLTFAPEAGTQRLRDIINKNISQEDIEKCMEVAFRQGWRKIKLYFMIGLPYETYEDLEGIAALVKKIETLAREVLPLSEARKIQLTVNISPFCAKSHTPFQWTAQNSLEEIRNKQGFLREKLRSRRVKLKWHNPEASFVEGVLARGDRRVAEAVETAWQKGCRFDGWSEQFSLTPWMEAFAEKGIDPEFYVTRERAEEEVLPWDHIDCGVSRDFLLQEYQRAKKGGKTLDCRWHGCYDCGLCGDFGCANILDRLREGKEPQRQGKEPSLPARPIRSRTQERNKFRVRLRFTKRNEARFLSQLDMVRLFSRVVRRAALPILYSQGFNPRPQISFGPPPAVGVESESEYADLMLARPMSPRELVARLNQNLIAGVQVLQAEIIDPKARSLMSRIEVADYTIEVRLDGAFSGMATKDGPQKEKLEKFVTSLTKLSDKVIAARLESLSGSTALLRILGRAGSQGSFKPFELSDLWREKFTEEDLVLEKVKRVGLYYYRGGELKDLFET